MSWLITVGDCKVAELAGCAAKAVPLNTTKAPLRGSNSNANLVLNLKYLMCTPAGSIFDREFQ